MYSYELLEPGCYYLIQEKETAQDFDRNSVARQVLTLILGPEINLLGFYLVTDVDELHKRATADLNCQPT